MDINLPKQPPEKEDGNKEYKRYLFYCKKKQRSEKDFISKRSSQMLYRLIEGGGKAIYLIGVDDNGRIFSLNDYYLNETIKCIEKISKDIGARVRVVRIYKNNVCTIRINLKKDILEKKLSNMMIY